MSVITTINATDKPRLSREVINTNFANLNAGKAEIADVVLLAGSYTNPSWIVSLAWAKITGAPSTYAPSNHTHPFTEITSTIADAQVPASAVTQHQAALSIATSQLTGTLPDARVAQSNVTQHQAALAIATSQVTSGTFADARIAASNITQHQAALSLAASQIASGQLALARGGTGADLSATGGTGFVLKQTAAGAAVSVAALVAADIPSLDASKITTGTFADARIAASNVTQHQAALSITASQISDRSTALVTSLTGTPNRVTVSGANGAITLNGPQDLHTAASPTFAGLTLIGNAIVSSAGTTSLFLKADNAYAWNIQATTGSADLKIIRGTDTYGSIGWGNGTFTWYNQTATTGSTSLVVRAGAGQSTNALITWQNNAGTALTTMNADGQMAFGNNLGVILQNVGGGAAASLYRDTSDDVILRNATANKAIYFRAGGDSNQVSLSATGVLKVYGDTFVLATAKTPSSAADTGTTGQIAWDASYIYVATGTNTWKRAALSTW